MSTQTIAEKTRMQLQEASKTLKISIPGLMAKMPQHEQDKIADQLSNHSYAGNSQTIDAAGPLGWDGSWIGDSELLKYKQYKNPLDLTPNKVPPYGGGVAPYNPLGNGSSIVDENLLREMQEFMKQGKPFMNKRSAFELMVEEMFTTAEKEQVLIDMGYEFTTTVISNDPPKITRRLADGTTKVITNSLEDLFLKEIVVKFKNILLRKEVLKLKI